MISPPSKFCPIMTMLSILLYLHDILVKVASNDWIQWHQNKLANSKLGWESSFPVFGPLLPRLCGLHCWCGRNRNRKWALSTYIWVNRLAQEAVELFTATLFIVPNGVTSSKMSWICVLLLLFTHFTVWHITLFSRFGWHQNKGCVSLYPPYTKTQLAFAVNKT